jgi:hypothetical protein
MGECTHTVTVRRIGNGWNVRVLLNGEVNQERRVYYPSEIGREAAEMLRMEDKCGNISQYASAARERNYCNPAKLYQPNSRIFKGVLV